MDETFDKIKKALGNIKPSEFEWKSDSKTMGVTAQEIGEFDLSVLSDTITIDTSQLYGAVGSSYGSSNYSIGTSAVAWGTLTSGSQTSLRVTGNAEFEGAVTIKGVSIAKSLEDIQKRLAILVPDPAKLEHFEALKKAYEHYKTLEALCQVPTKEEENK